MDLLKKTIEEEGVVLSPSVLKVDGFLNHKIDPILLDEIGKEFAGAFRNLGITKVLTIESGGIVPAFTTALYLNVPVVFAKKAEPSTMRNPKTCRVHSFTKNTDYTICIEQNTIHEGDRVLFIDDFLANGQAYLGIKKLVGDCHARLVASGFCIEKAWQPGHSILKQDGFPFKVLASIRHMSPEEGISWNYDTAETE